MKQSEKFREVTISKTTTEESPILEIVKDEKKAKPQAKQSKIGMVEDWLSYAHEFRFNTIKYAPECRAKGSSDKWEMTKDRELATYWRQMAKDGINFSIGALQDLLKSDFTPAVNPVRQYLQDLKWDGKDHIGELASTLTVSNFEKKVWTNLFQKWVVAMVANVFVDEFCANHVCLVLTGGQGAGKSTWIRNIVPKDIFGYYYEGKIDPLDKDYLFLSASNILMNVDDFLDEITKQKAGAFKGFITLPFVKARPPFARATQEFTKISSYAATSNHDAFLHDSTGSRRFLSAHVTKINHEASNLVDRGGVFAQAYALFMNNKYQYWLTKAEEKAIQDANKDFEVQTDEFNLFLKYFRHPKEDETPQLYTNTEIMEKLQVNTIIKSLSPKRLGAAIQKAGFTRGSYDPNRRDSKFYKVIYQERSFMPPVSKMTTITKKDLEIRSLYSGGKIIELTLDGDTVKVHALENDKTEILSRIYKKPNRNSAMKFYTNFKQKNADDFLKLK